MENFTVVLFLYSSLFLKVAKLVRANSDEAYQNNQYILLRGNDDLTVDLDIGDDDYANEMIGGNKKEINENSDQSIFHEFDIMASKEYETLMERKRAEEEAKNKRAEPNKRNMSMKIPSRKRNVTNEKVEYEYLLSTCYADVLDDTTKAVSDEPVQVGQPDIEFLAPSTITSLNISQNCTGYNSKGSGIQAIPCMLEEFVRKHQDHEILAKNSWKIAGIWLAMYIVIAVPFWCTRGWCCCCLCCRVFKPQQTIQEARNYLLLNPPGILVTKKGGIIHYEPTEREKDCYEEFGHFLRTL